MTVSFAVKIEKRRINTELAEVTEKRAKAAKNEQFQRTQV
jgi:hypothetical protein